MKALTSMSDALLFIGSVVLFGMLAVGLHWFLHRTIPPDRRQSAGNTAAAYMTALGSLFAILTGFLINTEYGTLRQTQNLVATETAAATRLAWATEGLPSVDVALIQSSLAAYLGALDQAEWESLSRGDSQRSEAFPTLAALQRDVFNIGSRSYAPASSVEGMRTAVSDLTSARRERIAIASQVLPAGLFWLSAIAGLALIVNALIVTLRSGRWTTVVTTGIVLIVALDLALVVAISAPFEGGFQASLAPLAELHLEVLRGQYLPWLA